MRSRILNILRNAGSPRQTAAAFALGVFLSFSPLVGLQIALGFAAAFALRLSRVVMFAGLCVNLPWLMLPWYTLATLAGAFLLQEPITVDLDRSIAQLFELPLTGPAFWTQSMELAAPFFWSFVVGSTGGALLLGVVAYIVVLRYLNRRASTDVAVEAPVEMV